jgi:hypothetical protein
MKSSVWPSGVPLATNDVPIMPPAPGRFSTITFWPRRSESRGAIMRPTTSVLPPAAKGETSLIGRLPG